MRKESGCDRSEVMYIDSEILSQKAWISVLGE